MHKRSSFIGAPLYGPQERRSRARDGFGSKMCGAALNAFKTRNTGGWWLVVSLMLVGCASIQQPMGGPKDIEPPKVLKVVPANLSTNFKAKKITIDFDEYIKLQNEFKEVSISPEQERPPVLKAKGRRLEIELQDTLEKNTTYTLNFGNAIADNNEGNELKNYRYVFSTGPVLDSLSISGKVISAFTQLPQLDAFVFLLPLAADTTFGKKKPTIFTRTDSAGNFKLLNLKKGSYKIYALKETNGDKLYTPGTEEIAFEMNTLELEQNLDGIKLQLFQEPQPTVRILDRKITPDGTILLSFNKPLTNPTVNITEPANLNDSKIHRFTKQKDSVRIWVTDMSFDSLKIAVSENQQLLQTVNISRAKKDTYTGNPIPTDNIEANGSLNPTEPLKFTFLYPVVSIDQTKIKLLEDSVVRTNFQLLRDSTDYMTYRLIYPWREKTNYQIQFADGAITGILNSKNKAFVRKATKADVVANYGTVDITLKLPPDSGQFIFEYLNADKIVVKRAIITRDTVVKMNTFKVGKYYARVIYDENRNGIWDTGILSKKLQPEKIYYDPGQFPIRANWETKYIITVPPKPR